MSPDERLRAAFEETIRKYGATDRLSFSRGWRAAAREAVKSIRDLGYVSNEGVDEAVAAIRSHFGIEETP